MRYVLLKKTPFMDTFSFLKSWLENPKIVGAISPSGQWLAHAMADFVDPLLPGLVVELGAGTGSVTKALIERGIAPERLVLVECDVTFARLLKQKFPASHIITGDAYSLEKTLESILAEPLCAIVSSLPLLMVPEFARVDLLKDALHLMHHEGVFVQFTYGMIEPIPRRARHLLNFSVRSSLPIWRNIPPARVFAYQFNSKPYQAQISFFGRIKQRADPDNSKKGLLWVSCARAVSVFINKIDC